MVWMTAAEALDVLNVRPQTLYANVSRGKIRARPDDDDPRRSLYHRDDVLRMARRANGRRKVEAVSTQAMQYGDPVLPSAISTALDGRLYYRGQDAAVLSDTASLEDIAALLWECPPAEAAAIWASCLQPAPASVGQTTRGGTAGAGAAIEGGDAMRAKQAAAGGGTKAVDALAAGLLALAQRSASDRPSLGRPAAELRAEAASVLATLIAAMVNASTPAVHASGGAGADGADSAGAGAGGPCAGGGSAGAGSAGGPCAGGGSAGANGAAVCAPGDDSALPISRRLARAWRAEQHEDLIRRALVLMADHELNASTFATRVAISTGAALAAGVLAGFTTLTGPLHGGAAAEFAQLAAQAQAGNADDAVRRWLASQRPLPGFGHPLYPAGDPRAQALLKKLPEIQPLEALAVAAEQQAGELPSIDYALAALTAACGLPKDAPFILFATGRCVGWLAHALEQVRANRLIRPRARYTGPAPLTAGIY
ncbi:citrate synthase family protein [Duganella sp. P38]|uniref:citrate synthase family protein n=1 Tax=Duganella sp. P38 TaxID=3423949 RepID=UPI003D798923